MSLINQMLQDLDARGTPAGSAGVLQGQVRAVPERHGVHPAWWLVLVLMVILCAGAAWIGFVPATAPATTQAAAVLPLKLAPNLSIVPPAPSVAAIDNREVAAPESLQIIASDASKPAEAPVSVAAAQPAVTPQVVAVAAPTVQSTVPVAAPLQMQAVKPALATASPEPVFAAANLVPATPPQPVKNSAVAAAPVAAEALASSGISKQLKALTPQQRAENDFRRGTTLIQQGKVLEAITALEQALQLDMQHAAARQTLVALLIESRRQDEAIRRLREGLQVDASQTGLAVILARLQVDRGELKPAVATLQRSLPHASDRADDYHAFLAALLQRDARHKDAIEHYSQALRTTPQNGLWWMGLGISLQAENRVADAIAAYRRAKTGVGLSPELLAFVDEKLNNLQR